MSPKDLLTRIYTSDEIKELKQKLEPRHMADDIIQHVFTELYAKPDLFIEELEQRQKLKAYIVKQIWNISHYTKDKFYEQFGFTSYGHKKENETDFCDLSKFEILRYEDPNEFIDEKEQEAKTQKKYNGVKAHMGQMHWYKVRVFELYVELGTYRAVSDMTGIPTTSVYRTVQEMKNELKRKI